MQDIQNTNALTSDAYEKRLKITAILGATTVPFAIYLIASLLVRTGFLSEDFLAPATGLGFDISILGGTLFVFFIPVSVAKRFTIAIIHAIVMFFLLLIYIFVLLLLGVLPFHDAL